MPRIARIVVPREPHHVIQRGNRRLPTFFVKKIVASILKGRVTGVISIPWMFGHIAL